MATAFGAEWKTVKDTFVKTARDVPPEISMLLSQGRDFGPALKAFDSASTFEKRMQCMPNVLRAKTEYETEITAALKTTESKVGRKAQEALLKQIDKIWTGVEEAAQPPRPSGAMVPAYRLRTFDLAAGVKTEFLKVDPILITVEIEVDKVFKALIDAGEAGLRAEELGDIAKAELETLRDAFRATILAVDASIRANPTTLVPKTKEANEVLVYYGKLVEDRVYLAVEGAWKDYLGRKKALKDFRIKSATKIVLGSIGVGVAVASVVLSFGTGWMSIIAACKGIVEVANTIRIWAEEIDTVYAKLVDDMEHVTDLASKRAEAEKSGKGQKASKLKEVLKEVVSAVLPISKDLMKTASAMEARCVQFSGLVSKLESKTDELSGKIETITKHLGGLPDRMLSTEQINLNRRMGKTITAMFTEIADLNTKSKACAKFAKASTKAVATLRAKDTWAAVTEKVGGLGTKGVALVALAKFCVQAGGAAHKLMSVLPH